MLQKKRQRELEKQFREMIQMMSTALSAGYSVDNAIRVCRRDLERMYGSGGMIVRETGYMVRQMEMNRPVEELLEDFALRSGGSGEFHPYLCDSQKERRTAGVHH